MPDLSAKMKAAADLPLDDINVDAIWQRGKGLRIRRALGASVLGLVILSGGAWAAIEGLTGDAADKKRNTKLIPAETPASRECEPLERTSDQKAGPFRCIGSGDVEGVAWSWYAYFYEKDGGRDLCNFVVEPSGRVDCASPHNVARRITLTLSSEHPLEPMVNATLPEGSASAYVEMSSGKKLEMETFDAPAQLGVPIQYALYFQLPRDAVRVVALSEQGEVIDTKTLDWSEIPSTGDGGGWIVAFDIVRDEPWTLSVDEQRGTPLHCVELGLGNDIETTFSKLQATWCSDSGDAGRLLLEQMWWSDLKGLAPVFGSVPREAATVTLELADGSSESIPLLKSPVDGSARWRGPIYDTDFIVALPPLGSEGQVVARATDGAILSTWGLCLDSAATEGVAYAACDERTEFWQPPE
jgi:hypothetical protein